MLSRLAESTKSGIDEYPNLAADDAMRPAHFRPFVPDASRIREFTPRALGIGIILGIVFGASSLYLVLKVGLAVGASISVAALSIIFFRLFSKFGAKPATILEHT